MQSQCNHCILNAISSNLCILKNMKLAIFAIIAFLEFSAFFAFLLHSLHSLHSYCIFVGFAACALAKSFHADPIVLVGALERLRKKAIYRLLRVGRAQRKAASAVHSEESEAPPVPLLDVGLAGGRYFASVCPRALPSDPWWATPSAEGTDWAAGTREARQSPAPRRPWRRCPRTRAPGRRRRGRASWHWPQTSRTCGSVGATRESGVDVDTVAVQQRELVRGIVAEVRHLPPGVDAANCAAAAYTPSIASPVLSVGSAVRDTVGGS